MFVVCADRALHIDKFQNISVGNKNFNLHKEIQNNQMITYLKKCCLGVAIVRNWLAL